MACLSKNVPQTNKTKQITIYRLLVAFDHSGGSFNSLSEISTQICHMITDEKQGK